MAHGTEAIAAIREALGSLAAAERRVAEAVLADPHAVVKMTASQLGAAADTSAMTVIRFARSVGFAGFQELAISLLLSEPADDDAAHLPPTGSPQEILTQVAATANRAIAASVTTVDPTALGAAADAIRGARQVLCLGAGLSHPVASDLSYRLNHLGIASDAPADRHVQRARAMQLTSDDVCVAVLQGGTFPPIVSAAQEAAAGGAQVIGLTSFRGTPLAEAATIPLLTGADEVKSMVEAWPVRMQFMVVIDALVLALMNTDDARSTRSLQRMSELIEGDNL